MAAISQPLHWREGPKKMPFAGEQKAQTRYWNWCLNGALETQEHSCAAHGQCRNRTSPEKSNHLILTRPAPKFATQSRRKSLHNRIMRC
jgi:hypothetical protein